MPHGFALQLPELLLNHPRHLFRSIFFETLVMVDGACICTNNVERGNLGDLLFLGKLCGI